MSISAGDLKEHASKLVRFITVDLWRFRLSDLSRTRAFLVKQLRILIFAVRGFREDECATRASSLTFFSLLSLVPVVAMIFGIAKGFGLEKILEEQLVENFPEQGTVLNQVISFAHTLLENTKGGIVAGIGIIMLGWTVIKVLSHVETAFNEIWNVKSRGFMRKFSDYLMILVIFPITLILSGSVNVFISTRVAAMSEEVAAVQLVSPAIFFLLKLSPYVLVWVFFSFIYIVLPNTKVYFKAALGAALIAGTLYQITQWVYLFFQIGVAKYNAIYGSFAALPLFLVWMQVAWLIVLLGAEIAFAIQNVSEYEFISVTRAKISPFNKRLLSLLIARTVTRGFAEGKKPLTGPQISSQLGIPIRLVREMLSEFVDSGLFSQATTKELKEAAYQPASDISVFTVQHILDSLEKAGGSDMPVLETDQLLAFDSTLREFASLARQSPANRRIQDM